MTRGYPKIGMNRAAKVSGSKRRRGFSLLELLVATTVLSILCLLLANIMNHVCSIWIQSEGQIQKRSNSRAFLENISTDLKAALLPLSLDSSTTQSNLQFVLNPAGASLSPDILNPSALFWTAPVASKRTYGDIAEVGYFVRYQETGNVPSFQLCRFLVNPESASDATHYKIYDTSNRYAWLGASIIDWATSAQAPDYRGLFAENVIGFWVRCLDPENNLITRTAAYTRPDGTPVSSTTYASGTYDSMQGYQYTDRNGSPVNVAPPALPASVEICAVFLDSKTALHLTMADAATIRSLQSTVTKAADLTTFVNALPASIRPWARPFSTQIDIPVGRPQ